MKITLDDLQLEVSNAQNLSSAVRRFNKAYEVFEEAGGNLDFNVRVTTGSGTVGYKAVFQKKEHKQHSNIKTPS